MLRTKFRNIIQITTLFEVASDTRLSFTSVVIFLFSIFRNYQRWRSYIDWDLNNIAFILHTAFWNAFLYENLCVLSQISLV